MATRTKTQGRSVGGTPDAAASGDPASEGHPVKSVARLTGLTPDLIRAWERRYGVVRPTRGPRGARLYSGADVARLRLLGQLVGSGRAIGDIAALDDLSLRRMAQQEAASPPLASASGSADEALLDRLVAALQRFDTNEVEAMLGDAVLALGVAPFISRIGVPLLERIGTLWNSGELSVAEEHVASSTIRSLFGGLIRLRMPKRAPSFLLTAPGGERHELGLSMVAMLCQQAGLAVACAGVDLPAEEILAAARSTRVRVVGLALVSSDNRSNAVEQLRRIEAGLSEEVEIWLGGSDAAEVVAALGSTRAVVLQSVPALEREIARIAATSTPAQVH